jgi:NTP pyrophosphatase (non-canonical NTP hydrolase)
MELYTLAEIRESQEKGTRMTFTDYQDDAIYFAIYPGKGNNFVYPVLGLVGESGEVAKKVKKLIRDSNSEITPEARENIKKELGDVLWYLSAVAYEFDLDLDEIAESNLFKLKDHKNRDVLQGSGDNR